MSPEWIIAGAAVLTVLGGIILFLRKIDMSIAKNTFMTSEILKAQEVQWKKYDEHTEELKSHDRRITRVETRLDVRSES